MYRRINKLILKTIFCFTFITLYYQNLHAEFPFLNNSDSNETIDSVQIIAELLPGLADSDKTLKLWGRVDSGHHIYSVHPQGEFAPIPTQIIIDSPYLVPQNDISESETVLIQDEAFGQTLHVHQHDFWIEQKFRILEPQKLSDLNLKGNLLYQICSKRICSLPLTISFDVTVH